MLPVLAAAVPALIPAWILEGDDAEFGPGVANALSPAGDVNGDRFDDVLVGSLAAFPVDKTECCGPTLGTALVYLGATDGLATVAAWQGAPAVAGDTWFGKDVSGAGDVNADGFEDVLVTSLVDDDDGIERASLFLGSAAGLGGVPAWSTSAFGNLHVRGVGDIDGDGYDDVLVFRQGEVTLFRGGATGTEKEPSWTVERGADGFGYDAAGAGDVNGDGFDDLLVGLYYLSDPESNEGAVYVYHGSSTGLGKDPATVLEVNVAGSLFGAAVASAGDVNADGFADVIVGAMWYTNVEAYEGSAYVFLGSATGVTSTPVWSAETNLPYALFGSDVASIGDFDADGYDDVVVGAPNAYQAIGAPAEFERGGSFSVYLGFAGGVAPTPAYLVAEEQIMAFLGNTVASAGDVNADGFDDLLVSSHGYLGVDGIGRAYVYMGGPVDDLDDDGVPDALDACVGADAAGDADMDGICGAAADGAVLDCNDADPAVNPDAEELCDDGLDNNCDAEIDEGCDPAPPPVDEPAADEPVAENDGDEVAVARASMCDTAPAGTTGWAGVLGALAAAARRRRPRKPPVVAH